MPCATAAWKRLLSLVGMFAYVGKVLIKTWSTWLLAWACPSVIRREFVERVLNITCSTWLLAWACPGVM